MKILAIDPSPDKHAWVLWDTETHDFYGARMGMHTAEDLHGVLYDSATPELVAVEFPQNYGVAVGLSVLATAFEAGRIAATLYGPPLALYGRPTIKGQIGGRNDPEIRASLRMRHGEAKKGHKLYGVKNDIWAALALAVAIDENPNLRRVEWGGIRSAV